MKADATVIPRPRRPLPPPRSHLEACVRAHGGGDLIAAATLQRDMEVLETSFGAWAFRRVAGMTITLGGPLCAPTDRPAMIGRLLAQARRPVLFYLQEGALADLEGSGLHGVGVGVDRHVDLGSLLEETPKPVRGAVKKARKANVVLRELDLSRLPADTRAAMEAITADYLAHSEITAEMSFINRPMSYRPDGLRRVFLLERSDREGEGPFGYAVLNPIFEGGRRSGWLLDLLRFGPTRLWGVWFSTVHALAELVAAEGEGLSLGFCPLHGVAPAPHVGSRALFAQVEWMERYLGSARYLERLRQMKGTVPGPAEPRYMASFTRLAPVALYAFMEAMGVGFSYLFGPDLIDVLEQGVRDNLVGGAA